MRIQQHIFYSIITSLSAPNSLPYPAVMLCCPLQAAAWYSGQDMGV